MEQEAQEGLGDKTGRDCAVSCTLKGQFLVFKGESSVSGATGGAAVLQGHSAGQPRTELSKAARSLLLSALRFLSQSAAGGHGHAEEHAWVSAWEQDLPPTRTPELCCRFVLGFTARFLPPVQRWELLCPAAAMPGSENPRSRRAMAIQHTNQLPPALLLSLSTAFVTSARRSQARRVSLFK